MTTMTLRRVSSIWVVVAIVLAVWCRFSEALPFRLMSDWQIRVLGTSFPQSTQWMLALVLAVPALIGLFHVEQSLAQGDENVAQKLQRTGSLRFRILLALAALAALAALLALALTLSLPKFDGPARLLDLSASGARAGAGPAVVSGARPLAGEYRFATSYFGQASYERFLPVSGPTHQGGSWLVIERPDDGLTFDAATLPTRFTGVLVADALQGSTEAELRKAGHLADGADSHYWVLFTDRAALFRPYRAAAAELLVMAMVFLAAAGLQFWRLRRLSVEA